MNVIVRNKFFSGDWSIRRPLDLNQLLDWAFESPVTVETEEEAEFLEGYCLVYGKRFADIEVIPGFIETAIYRTAKQQEIQIQIKVNLP